VSQKSREYDARVAQTISEVGAEIVGRARDGGGHHMITLRHHGQERTFHYACTGTSRGHGIRNMQQRLRWLLNDIPKPQFPEMPEPAPELQLPVVTPPAPPAADQPAKPRLTKQRRSEIVKRYAMVGVTIDTIMAEFHLSHKTAETLLLATEGAVRTKYERERHNKRAADARRIRGELKPLLQTAPVLPTIRELTRAECRRMWVLHYYGMKPKLIAELFSVTVKEVYGVVYQKESRYVR
jgi:AraC-like DNA-binding protein